MAAEPSAATAAVHIGEEEDESSGSEGHASPLPAGGSGGAAAAVPAAGEDEDGAGPAPLSAAEVRAAAIAALPPSSVAGTDEAAESSARLVMAGLEQMLSRLDELREGQETLSGALDDESAALRAGLVARLQALQGVFSRVPEYRRRLIEVSRRAKEVDARLDRACRDAAALRGRAEVAAAEAEARRAREQARDRELAGP